MILTIYDSWPAIGQGLDLRAARLKATLHGPGYQFSNRHRVYADVSDELDGNGYTTGGATLIAVTWGGKPATLNAADVLFRADGDGFSASRAVVRVVGKFDGLIDPLIGSIFLGDEFVAPGDLLRLRWNVNGIYVLELAA